MRKGLLLLAASLILSGCSWVQPLPGADDVALMNIEDVTRCHKLGTTHTQTLDKITMFPVSWLSEHEEDEEALH